MSKFRSTFSVAEKLIHLDAANVALTHNGCFNAMTRWQSDLHRSGSAFFNAHAEERATFATRKAAANMLNTDRKNIACGTSSTELLSSFALATKITPSNNIVSTQDAFPSTVYPWYRRTLSDGCSLRLASTSGDVVDDSSIDSLIDDETFAVVLSHVEYSTGQKYDLRRWSDKIHSKGGILVVDATQSMGCIPIDVEKEGIDVLVASGYKWLCSSFGCAVMYIHPRLQNLLPGLIGFRSHKDMWKLDATRLLLPDDATRYEHSTMHFGSIIGMAESLEYLTDIGVDRVHNHNMNLISILEKNLGEMPGVSVVSFGDAPILSFTHCNIAAETIVDYMQSRDITVTNRAGRVRVSPHIYNTENDIHIFLYAFRDLLELTYVAKTR